jgi:flagellar protein FliS
MSPGSIKKAICIDDIKIKYSGKVGAYMAVNPFQVYKQTDINTASKGKLVLMLYNGTIRFINEAKTAISDQRPAEAHEKITRASDIITELRMSLDESAGDIAVNLDKLYEYIEWRLVQGNIKKSIEQLDAALAILTDIRDAWAKICSSPTV